MSDLTPDFIQIPSQVLNSKSLRPSDKFLFGYLNWLNQLKNKNCTASNNTLAELTGVSSRAIQLGIGRLKDSGFISVQFSGDSRSSNTIRTIKTIAKIPKSVRTNVRTQQQGAVRTNVHTPTNKCSPNKEKIIRTKKELVFNSKKQNTKQPKMPDLNGDFYDNFSLARIRQNA